MEKSQELLKGTRTNWEDLKKAIDERWELVSNVIHCKKHDTYFDDNEEPCWQCYNDFEEEI